MSPFSFVLEFEIRDGQEEAFREFMREMVDVTEREEPGTLVYEWFLSDDGKRCHVLERFADSAAFLKHAASFANFAERCAAATTVGFCHVYGSPEDEVKKTMAGFRPRYFDPLGGFRR